MQTEPIAARELSPTEDIPEDMKSILTALKDTRKSILSSETLEGNDPKALNSIRKELSDLGDAINAYLRRGNAKPLEALGQSSLLSVLQSLASQLPMGKVCRLCDVVDTLFKQAPFTPNPSHALLLQKNIQDLQKDDPDTEV